jgi:hypothetical protein
MEVMQGEQAFPQALSILQLFQKLVKIDPPATVQR